MASPPSPFSILDYPLEQVKCHACDFFLYSIKGQRSEPFMREHMLECAGIPKEHRRYYRNSKSLTPPRDHRIQSPSYGTYVTILDEILHGGSTSSASSRSLSPDSDQTDIDTEDGPEHVPEDTHVHVDVELDAPSDGESERGPESAWPSNASATPASTSSRDSSAAPASAPVPPVKGKRKPPRGTEEALQRRYDKLAEDYAIVAGSVEFTQVTCAGCQNVIKLDKRQKYYSTLWEKHRDRCSDLVDLRALEAAGKDTRQWISPVPSTTSKPELAVPSRTRKSGR